MFSLSWELNQFFKIKTVQEKAKTQQKCDFCFLFLQKYFKRISKQNLIE